VLGLGDFFQCSFHDAPARIAALWFTLQIACPQQNWKKTRLKLMAWVAKSNGQANRTDTTLPGKHLPVQDFVVRNINSLGLSFFRLPVTTLNEPVTGRVKNQHVER